MGFRNLTPFDGSHSLLWWILGRVGGLLSWTHIAGLELQGAIPRTDDSNMCICNWHGFIIVCLMSWRLYIMHNLYVYLYAKIIKNTTHVGVLDTTVEQVPRCLSKNPVMGLWFASNLGMLKTLVPCSHLTKKIAGNYGCSSLQILGKRCFDPSRPSDDIPSGYD